MPRCSPPLNLKAISMTQLCPKYKAIFCEECFVVPTIQSACPMQDMPMCFTGRADGMHVLCSAGPIAVKAAVLTIVEKMHAKGIGMLYAGWPADGAQVGSTGACMHSSGQSSELLRAPADLPAGTCIQGIIRAHHAVCRWHTSLQPSWLWTTCMTAGSTGRTAGCTAGCCTSASMLSTTCAPAADMHGHVW